MIKAMKLITVFILLLVLVGIVLSLGKQAPALDPLSDSALRLKPGPYSVNYYDETIIDRSRSTQANGDFAGTDSRTLVSTLWYPDRKVEGGFPLIVYSHGFSSNRSDGEYLAQHLTSKGYVVVAADFPLTNASAPGGPLVKDVVNQPADVSFLIDTLLQHNFNPEHALADMIDPERIGLMGLSLGGMTTTLAAYHPTMADSRVDAALSLAGPTDQFTAAFFQQRTPAFLMLAGTADALVPYSSNALPVLQKIPNAQLLTIAEGSHMGFSGSASLLRWINHPDSIGCYVVMSNLDDADSEAPWFDLLGTPEQGINYQSTNELCQQNPLPKAINPLRQQQISRLVVSSFFDSQFSPSPENKTAADTFLQQTLPQEFAELSYSRAKAIIP
ncbi:CocE/NonD family hydrolase [Oceanicoccus sp. KOV_DT_Chl]|uniref:alpha/beta hydrolase family protein n=1 Tax=Oceanicoccus sp. KOV_DT_Chl TaxID=1904639 RepID=UPI000C7D9B50|nr:CocE/NonD family hydrolase [Oceanicoccus sp. KOV_DT_Chl]